MNVDELATEAVNVIAQRLPELTDAAGDALVAVIRDRLERSRSGTRAMESLHRNPGGTQERELAAAVLADELMRDPDYAKRLASVLGRPQIPTQRSTVTVGGGSVVRGDVAGGNIDKSKRFHIGSIRFGGGGMTALIVAGLLGLGGGGAAIYSEVTQPSYAEDSLSDTKVTISGSSFDVDDVRDAEGQATNKDNVADLTAARTGFIATGGAAVGPLNAGVVPTPGTCDSAIDAHGKRTVENVHAGDVFCVRTSKGAVAAVTVSKATDAAGTIIYTLDYAYWARA